MFLMKIIPFWLIYRYLERLLATCLTTYSHIEVLSCSAEMRAGIFVNYARRLSKSGGCEWRIERRGRLEDKIREGGKHRNEEERNVRQGLVTDSDGPHFIHDMVLRLTAATTSQHRSDPIWSNEIWSNLVSFFSCRFIPCIQSRVSRFCFPFHITHLVQAYLLCHLVGLTKLPHWGLFPVSVLQYTQMHLCLCSFYVLSPASETVIFENWSSSSRYLIFYPPLSSKLQKINILSLSLSLNFTFYPDKVTS